MLASVDATVTTIDSDRSDAIASGKRGWSAELNLAFDKAPDKTILRRSHSGPLMIQRPFYPEGAVCHTYILHPPGGIVGGDRLIINAQVKRDAHALVTTPGASKYYGTNGHLASQQQVIELNGGTMEWFPTETIYFSDCHALQSLSINLDSTSRFIGWDINCFGRPSGNHHFTSGAISTRLEVFVDKHPVLLEQLKLNGAEDMQRITGLRGATVSATLLAIAPQATSTEWLEMTREQLQAHEFAATQINGLLIVRYLGHSTEAARAGFIKVWQLLRPIIVQKPFAVPRIWAT